MLCRTSIRNSMDRETQMHHGCRISHDSCTVFAMSKRSLRRRKARTLPHPRPAPEPTASTARVRHSSGAVRRAARLHPQPGRRSARPKPVHVHPQSPTVCRDDRNALGREADPRRRARTPAHRTETSRQTAPCAGTPRPPTAPISRGHRANPLRTRRRQESAPDCRSPQRRPGPNRTWRRAVVGLNCPLRSRPLEPATVRSRRPGRAAPSVTAGVNTCAQPATSRMIAGFARASAESGRCPRPA